MDFLPIATLKAVIAELDAGGTVLDLKRKLTALADQGARIELPPEINDGRRARGRSYYDRLVEDILGYVRTGGTREGLVRLAMERLGADRPETAADGYLLLEAQVSRKGALSPVKVIDFVGLHPDRIANFQLGALSGLAESALIREVLIGNRSIDFLSTELARSYIYNHEFDALIDHQRGAWIAAVPLPGLNERHPNRALVGLFRVAGAPGQTLLPRGAAQEWRCLEFLRAGYDLLNHQLASVAEQARAQRRDLMAELAPGIVNHEVNQQVRILADTTDLMNLALRRLAGVAHDDPALATLIDALIRQYQVVDRLTRMSSAFMNLHRRSSGGEVSLMSLLGEVESLLHYRMAHLGIAFDIGPFETMLTLQTDAMLLEHVVLNVLMNAMDAIADNKAAGGTRRITVLVSLPADTQLAILLANTGPAIPGTIRDRIFERGVSDKPHGIGHGLGLYICRLAVRFLGGDIELAAPEQLPADHNVGFCVTLPRFFANRATLADEAQSQEETPNIMPKNNRP